jgi:hypothetical protein
LTQVDVLEGGRIVTDMLGRELQQMRASYGSNVVNFYAYVPPYAMEQVLPGAAAVKRTNLMEECYFLTRENQTWTAVGYRVSDPTNGVGSLYRFESSSTAAQTPVALFGRYNATPLTNMSKLLDGVVHFKVRAYNPAGQWITQNINTNNTDIFLSPTLSEVERYNFYSNALPAFVELEIGLLEDRTLRRAQSIPAGTARRTFLTNQVGKVHIFRMHVPVRNVDPDAYQ